jgi:hypothetical protein
LVVGDTPSSNVSRSLESAFNVTYIQLLPGTNLTKEIDSSNYRNILWSSDANSIANASVSTIENFVEGGGSLIVATTPPSWMNANLTAFLATSNSVSSGSSSISNAEQQKELQMIVGNTGFSKGLSIEDSSSQTVMAQNRSLQIGVHIDDEGRVIVLESGNNLSNASQVSDYSTLLSNAVASSSNVESPFWYPDNQGNNSNAIYSLTGQKGGPLLVWISNPSRQNLNFSLDLNSTFYGIGNSYELIYPTIAQAVAGNGSTVQINSVLAQDTWTPVYVVSSPTQFRVVYSNLIVTSQDVFPDQGYYTLVGSQNESSIVAVPSAAQIQNVELNGHENLTSVNSALEFKSSSIADEWYYNKTSGILFVKYDSNVTDSIRVYLLQSAAKSSTTTFFIYAVYAIGVALGAEVLGIAYFRRTRRKGVNKSGGTPL